MRDLRKYNPEGSPIRNYQYRLLDIMVEFDTFCRQHQISYSLAGGTLLGGVRHKGFIPWDDDADLMITRTFYNKLIDSLEKNKNAKIEVYYRTIMPRLRIKGSEDFIDLVVYDNASSSLLNHKISTFIAIFLSLIIKCRERIDNRYYKNIKPWFLLLPFAFLLPMITWQKIQIIYISRIKHKSNSVACYATNPSHLGIKLKNEIFNSYLDIQFEQYKLMAISDYDSYLKRYYGDYMRIPDDKDIKVHGRTSNV